MLTHIVFIAMPMLLFLLWLAFGGGVFPLLDFVETDDDDELLLLPLLLPLGVLTCTIKSSPFATTLPWILQSKSNPLCTKYLVTKSTMTFPITNCSSNTY